jgi:hypothetical protein
MLYFGPLVSAAAARNQKKLVNVLPVRLWIRLEIWAPSVLALLHHAEVASHRDTFRTLPHTCGQLLGYLGPRARSAASATVKVATGRRHNSTGVQRRWFKKITFARPAAWWDRVPVATGPAGVAFGNRSRRTFFSNFQAALLQAGPVATRTEHDKMIATIAKQCW